MTDKEFYIYSRFLKLHLKCDGKRISEKAYLKTGCFAPSTEELFKRQYEKNN